MIVAAVQDVNVVRDFWDWAGLAAGVVGAVMAAWAIWYTARTRRDLVAERGRIFELEVLREILTGVEDGFLFEIADEPMRLRKFARRLDLLPGSDLPTWRILVDMRWPDDVRDFIGAKAEWSAWSVAIAHSAKLMPLGSAPLSERVAWQETHDRLASELRDFVAGYHESTSRRLLAELVHAITLRVDAGRLGQSRRHWWGGRRKPVGHVDQVRHADAGLPQ